MSKILELALLYNNLDLGAIKAIDEAGLNVVATEKKCKELGITNNDSGIEISVPVYSKRYKLQGGEYIKAKDVSIAEFIEMKDRGLLIEEKRVTGRKIVRVFDIEGYDISEYKLDLSCIDIDKLEGVVDIFAMYECVWKDDVAEVRRVIMDGIVGGKVVGTVEDRVLSAVIAVLNRVAAVMKQKYILDIKKECYEELISDLLDDMEANYIRKLAGI